MATIRMDNNSNANADPIVKAAPGDTEGRLKVSYDEYTVSAALSNADVIKGPIIREGQRVHNVVVFFDGANPSTDVDVGWAASDELDADGNAVEAADANGFLDAVDFSSSAYIHEMRVTAQGTVAGQGKRFSADCELELLVNTAGAGSDGTLRVWVEYSEY
jgi:hypothetical protein